MKFLTPLLNGFIRFLLIAACRIDRSDLKRIPEKGPYILVANHINFLEAPILYLFLQPRRTIAMGKAELWNNRFSAFLMNLWEVVPIKRGAADFQGMKRCFDVLKNGDFLCLAPEGTRSRTGKLRKGKAGVMLFAQKGNVPIIPVAHWGGENLSSNLKRLKRTRITIRVGEPLRITPKEGEKIGADERQKIADEVMVSIARLMPEEYHGYYEGKTGSTPEYLLPCKTEVSES